MIVGTLTIALAWMSERSESNSAVEPASEEALLSGGAPRATSEAGGSTEADVNAWNAALIEELKTKGLPDSLLLPPVSPPHSDEFLGQLASEGFGLVSGRITWPENVDVDEGANPLVRFWELDADSPHWKDEVGKPGQLAWSTPLRSNPSLRHGVEWEAVGLPNGVYAVSYGGHDLPVPIIVEAGVQHFDLEIPETHRFDLHVVDARTGAPVVVDRVLFAPVRLELPAPVSEEVEGPAAEFGIEVDCERVWLWIWDVPAYAPLVKEPFEVPIAEPRVLTVELEPKP